MIVIEAPKRAVHKRIAKMSRSIKHCDAAREFLPDAEMSRTPRDLIFEIHQTAGYSRNRALAGMGS